MKDAGLKCFFRKCIRLAVARPGLRFKVRTMSSVSIGTPFSPSATKVLLLGSGELGKEVVIELQRFGCEVIAVDSYANAPAMQVADRSHVISMLDADALRKVLCAESPNYIVPEVEAIATEVLVELEAEGFTVIPTARAAKLTMNREGIRRLAAEELGLRCSPYQFAATEDEFRAAVKAMGFPCVVKPVMSSSGKGQSVVRSDADLAKSWQYAQEGGRAGKGKVIVEGFVDFDYEITLLTVRHAGGTSFCEPIGHLQIDGDYRESWQPQPMSPAALDVVRNGTFVDISTRRLRLMISKEQASATTIRRDPALITWL